jgi:hypothetical protein
MAFSPDGKLLATASLDHTVRLWEVDSGRPVRTFPPSDPAEGLAFSQDGKRLAFSSHVEVKVFDVASGAETITLRGHAQRVFGVAFSRDGKRLATGSEDGTVKLWDAVTGQEVFSLAGDARDVNSVCFNPDGRLLASGGGDGSVKVWDARPIIAPDAPVTEEEIAARLDVSRIDPVWHAAEETRAAGAGRRFAASYHLGYCGRGWAERGRWPQAVEAFSRLWESRPEMGEARSLALAQLAAGQPDGYRQTCRRLLARFGPGWEASQAALLIGAPPGHAIGSLLPLAWLVDDAGRAPASRALTARLCAVRPEGIADSASLLSLVSESDAETAALVLCRAGRPGDAIKRLGKPRDGLAWAVLALAEQGCGQLEAARRALGEVVRWQEAALAVQGQGNEPPWEDRVEGDLLRREVESLLAPGKP